MAQTKAKEKKQNVSGGFCFGPLLPEACYLIPEAERVGRVLQDSDLCVIDRKEFFIRGCLDIPILGSSNVFCWLVWVSLSEMNFNRAVDLWEDPIRESEPPYFGWLNSRLPYQPETVNLKVHVISRSVGERPSIELEATAHPLSQEQQHGISMQRAEEISKQLSDHSGSL